jgi:hypothetical protein
MPGGTRLLPRLKPGVLITGSSDGGDASRLGVGIHMARHYGGRILAFVCGQRHDANKRVAQERLGRGSASVLRALKTSLGDVRSP